MLTADTIRDAAMLDTERLASILVSAQVLDTPPGDAIMGHLAGSHPDRYRALIVALARKGHGAEDAA